MTDGPAHIGFYINPSIGGGPNVPVLVDTGSRGLTVPLQDVNLANLGTPGPSGTAHYGDSSASVLTEEYTTYTTTVNFGNGIVTGPTTVAVVTSAFRTDSSGQYTVPLSDIPAVMGVGVNVGHFPTSTVQALPGNLGQGVLVNDPMFAPGGTLEFGPNPLPAVTSVSGAPTATLVLQITPPGGTPGAPQTVYPSAIDAGGQLGVIPQYLVPGSTAGDPVPLGTTLTVYTGSGTELYQETFMTADAPTVEPTFNFNTGILPFYKYPIYISYSPSGFGTTIFDA
ncbi:hypothetical protein A5706_29555 [Mycobacterium sp. E796]|nr:hypothetical protein A5706_29555 [Mycobacterium sp. E796]